MIEVNTVRTFRKDPVEQRFTALTQKSIDKLLPFPRIFQYLMIENLGQIFSNRSPSLQDFRSTIHLVSSGMNTIGSFVTPPSSGQQKVVSIGRFDEDMQLSNCQEMSTADVKFVCTSKDGTEVTVACFFSQINHLIIGNIQFEEFSSVGGTLQRASLSDQSVRLIRAVFSKISRMGVKPLKRLKKKLMVGGDMEFAIHKNGSLISAHRFVDDSTSSPLGVDGHRDTGELRPTPSSNPELFVEFNVKKLMRELSSRIPEGHSVTTGGGFTSSCPLGDHVHFNKILSFEEVRLLDTFVGIPSRVMKGGKRSSNSYGKVSDLRLQPHGSEYRTCSSALIPELLKARYVTCYNVVSFWERMQIGSVLTIELDSNGVPRLQDYIKLAIHPKYEKYLKTFHKWVTTGKIDVQENILPLWSHHSKRKGSRKARKPRAVVTTYPKWYSTPTRIAVRNLKKQVDVSISTYSAKSLLPNHNISDVRNTIIVEMPPDSFDRLSEKEECRNRIAALAKRINKCIAVNVGSFNKVSIMYPYTWRAQKVKVFTPAVVKELVRIAAEGSEA